jgi:pterin-4a-carbinolamine dehydratase
MSYITGVRYVSDSGSSSSAASSESDHFLIQYNDRESAKTSPEDFLKIFGYHINSNDIRTRSNTFQDYYTRIANNINSQIQQQNSIQQQQQQHQQLLNKLALDEAIDAGRIHNLRSTSNNPENYFQRATEEQATEIADYNEELAIKLDLNFHKCETINGISINSSDEYYATIDDIRATENDLERGFKDCIKSGLADKELIDFMSVSNFVNETTEDLEKKYNNYLFAKRRNYPTNIIILKRINQIAQIAQQISSIFYDIEIPTPILNTTGNTTMQNIKVSVIINKLFETVYSEENDFNLAIKFLKKIAQIAQIAQQIPSIFYNTEIPSPIFDNAGNTTMQNIKVSVIINKLFITVYSEENYFNDTIEFLKRIAQIAQIAQQIPSIFYNTEIPSPILDNAGNTTMENIKVSVIINKLFEIVSNKNYFNAAITFLKRIAVIAQLAKQIPQNSYNNIFIFNSTEFTALTAIQQTLLTIYNDANYNHAIQFLTQIVKTTNPTNTLTAGSKNRFHELTLNAGSKNKFRELTLNAGSKNRFHELTLNAGSKMTGGASFTELEIKNFENDKGHFYVNGEIFDPTWTPWINEFGKEKILYSIMFGIEISMKKYIEELEKMAGGVGSSDKNSKREARLQFLLLAYNQKLPYDNTKMSRPLDDYFKRMLGYFNGSPAGFNFRRNGFDNIGDGIGHSGDKTGKVLYEIWAGGNIITCFAKLLQNIISHLNNIDQLVSINTVGGFEGSVLYTRMKDVLTNTQLIEAINKVASMPYSDFDANGCVLIENEEERAALFRGVAVVAGVAEVPDPQKTDYLTDQQLEFIKKHLEIYLNKNYFNSILQILVSMISGFNIFRIKNKYAFKKSNKYIGLEEIEETPDVSRKNIVKGLIACGKECGADKLFVGGVETAVFDKIKTLSETPTSFELTTFEFYYLNKIFKSNNIKTAIIQKFLSTENKAQIHKIVKTKIETLKKRVEEIKEHLDKADGTYNKTHLGSAKKFVSDNSLLFCDMFFSYDYHKDVPKDQAIDALIKFHKELPSTLTMCTESLNKSEFKQKLFQKLFSKIKQMDLDALSKNVYKYINHIETTCNVTGFKMTTKDRPIQGCLIAAFEQFIKEVNWNYNDPNYKTAFLQQIADSTQKKVCIDKVICEIKRIEGELKMSHLEQSFIEKYSDEIFNRIKKFESAKAEMTEISGHILHELFLKNILDQLSTSNVDKINMFFKKIEGYLMSMNENIVEEQLINQNSEMRNYIQIDVIDSVEILSSSKLFDLNTQRSFVEKYRENAKKYSLACLNFYEMLLLQKTYNNALTSFNVQCTIETMQQMNPHRTEIFSIIYYLHTMIKELNSITVANNLNQVLPLTYSLYTLNYQFYKDEQILQMPPQLPQPPQLLQPPQPPQPPHSHQLSSITQMTNAVLTKFFESPLTVKISKYTTMKLKAEGLLIKDTGERLVLDDNFDKLTNVANACVKHIASDKSCQSIHENPKGSEQCSKINETSSINAAKLKQDLIPVVQENIKKATAEMTETDVRLMLSQAYITAAAAATATAAAAAATAAAAAAIATTAAVAIATTAATMVMSFLYLTSNNVMIPTHMNDDNDLTDAVEDGCRIDSVVANELGIQIPRVACGVGGGKMRRKMKNNIKIKKTQKNKKRTNPRKTKRTNPRKTKQRKQPKQKISKKRSRK